jgi:hypothetical protein
MTKNRSLYRLLQLRIPHKLSGFFTLQIYIGIILISFITLLIGCEHAILPEEVVGGEEMKPIPIPPIQLSRIYNIPVQIVGHDGPVVYIADAAIVTIGNVKYITDDQGINIIDSLYQGDYSVGIEHEIYGNYNVTVSIQDTSKMIIDILTASDYVPLKIGNIWRYNYIYSERDAWGIGTKILGILTWELISLTSTDDQIEYKIHESLEGTETNTYYSPDEPRYWDETKPISINRHIILYEGKKHRMTAAMGSLKMWDLNHSGSLMWGLDDLDAYPLYRYYNFDFNPEIIVKNFSNQSYVKIQKDIGFLEVYYKRGSNNVTFTHGSLIDFLFNK